MNMPIADMNRRQIESFPTAKIMPFVNRRTKVNATAFENEQQAIALLDKHFALQTGSHKDVKQYVVYFRHIMAFFADGTHCGLEQSKQFVAFAGQQESPTSIILKQDDAHVELSINTKEIAVKSPENEVFTTPCGDDYIIES